MTLVDWVLDTIKDNWDGTFPDDLQRINRGDSTILEGSIRSRTAELKESNYAGAALTSRTPTPLGVDGDDHVEAVISVRVEGLHSDEWGHVDDEADFEALVDDIKQSLRQEQPRPSVGSESPGNWVRLYLENETPQSHLFADHFLTTFDVRLVSERETV